MDNNYNNENVYAQPAQSEVVAEPVSKKNSVVAMVLGICSICFSSSGVVGIVLAAISKSFRKKYLNESNGVGNGMIKAAGVTSTIGLIFSIIMVVVWVIYAIVFVALIGSGMIG